MATLGLLIAAAVFSVKNDGAELRADCDPSEPVVAKLAKGAAAKVKFGLNGCFAVEIDKDGATLTGFLPADAIDGIEVWEIARRNARSVDAGRDTARSSPVDRNGHPLVVASQLLVDNRPAEALEVAERGLASSPRDAQLLALAGIAAYKNDMAVRAIGYLKDSLAQRDDPALRRVLNQAEREKAADKSSQQLHSPRFLFRYDTAVMPAETARAVMGVLEQEYSRVSSELGCKTAERIAVIAQTREDYMRATGAAEWSGGQFDGRIRVALLESDPNGALTRRAFSHEIVHACLAGAGNWPAWFHEGLAQKLSGETLSAPKRASIRAMAKANELPKLGVLGQNWSRMSAGHAAMAYAMSLDAIDLFYEHHREYGIRNLIQNPDQLERITVSLDTLLRQ